MRPGRVIAAVLALALGACRTITPPPAPPCQGEIGVTQVAKGAATSIGLANHCYVPMLVELSLPKLENLRSSDPLPVRRAVAAHGEQALTTLDPIDTREPNAYTVSLAILAYGTVPPAPDDAYLYEFPFGGADPRTLIQGVDGGVTHTGENRFAFDFGMPIGTPIRAARAGIVLRVIDGFGTGGFDESFLNEANAVYVLHDDGTVAGYGHFSKGIRVRQGDRVSAGDELGLSGNSGYSQGPHLHFQVNTQKQGALESIPIRFRGGVVPEKGESYGPYE